MVLAFFKGTSGDGSFDHIVTRAVTMLSDARHSFDLATMAVLTEVDTDHVSADIRETDERINLAEQELRSELVVHVTVHGTADIGSVLGFTLLLKKIERVGDQAKNILDMAENNISLVGAPESAELLEDRTAVSALFSRAAELLSHADVSDEAIEAFVTDAGAIDDRYRRLIDDCMVSTRPGREIVPLAIYYRYVHRIVANLIGVVRTSVEPLQVVEDAADSDGAQ